MTDEKKIVPKIAIQSIGGGLFLMAFFTMMWNGIAENGFNGSDHYLLTVIFSIFSLTFIIYGLRFFLVSKKFPKLTTDADKKEGAKLGKWYGIIFGLEGVTIPLTVYLLLKFNSGNFIIPAIALIVGLHFYPMAKIFKRKIDYYLATWTCIIALIGIYMTATNNISESIIFSFIGIGVGIATSTYGFYMVHIGYLYTKSLVKI